MVEAVFYPNNIARIPISARRFSPKKTEKTHCPADAAFPDDGLRAPLSFRRRMRRKKKRFRQG
jgi:hypothetical protein